MVWGVVNKINRAMMQQSQMPEMPSSLHENPQTPIDLSVSYSGMVRKTLRLASKKNHFDECKMILNKSHDSRTPAEVQTLLRLSERNQFLKEMAEAVSPEFVKGIMRNAKIEMIEERQVIIEEDMDLKYMVIVLEGKLGVEKNSMGGGPLHAPPELKVKTKDREKDKTIETIDPSSLRNAEMFEQLTIMAKKERDQLRKSSKLQRKSSIPVSQYELMLPVLSALDYEHAVENIESKIDANGAFGARERLSGLSCRNRVFAVESSTLLVVEMSFLFYWLEAAFKHKLTRNVERIKKIAAFEQLEDEKMAEIILSMKMVRKPRNEVVYSQGDEADCLYVLLDGQLKMSKYASLFQENPNQLYTDRVSLMKKVEGDRKWPQYGKGKGDKDDVLKFANFKTLYNFRPVKKSIEMGVLSSFGLFGEEEVVFGRNRQVTVQVTSLQCSYFQISFKRILEIIGAKNVDRFKQHLQAVTSKKVLYRQSELAGHIHFQNSNSLDYFFIEDAKKPDASPKKLKLSRINELVVPSPPKESFTQAQPYYTTFNFNRFLDQNQNTPRERYSSQPPPARRIQQLSSTELKLQEVMHSWKPLQTAPDTSSHRKIKRPRHLVNVDDPLINQQSFVKVTKANIRLDKELRTIRLSLGKRKK